MLFELNDADYTRKIRQGTYMVNSIEQFTEWTDANYKTHRHVFRSQISGSFTMYFGNQAAFEEFLNDLAAAKIADGVYRIGLFANNINQWKGGMEAYINFTPAREQKVIGEAWFPELKVTVKER